MIIPIRKNRADREAPKDNNSAVKKPDGKKAELTTLVDPRGFPVRTIIKLRSGQNIQLSMDEARELGSLLSIL